ncbi:MAG: hypothetical protein Q9M44_07925 [Ghiorsea sp.]|nr:hypothetical protein [Ghiorsea sp.]
MSDSKIRRFFMIVLWSMWRSLTILPVVAGLHFVMSINPDLDLVANIYVWKQANIVTIIAFTAFLSLVAEMVSPLTKQLAGSLHAPASGVSLETIEKGKK